MQTAFSYDSELVKEDQDRREQAIARREAAENPLDEGLYKATITSARYICAKKSGQMMLVLNVSPQNAKGEPQIGYEAASFNFMPAIGDEDTFADWAKAQVQNNEYFSKLSSLPEGAQPEAVRKKTFTKLFAYSGSVVKLMRTLLGSETIPYGFGFDMENKTYVDKDGNAVDNTKARTHNQEIAAKAVEEAGRLCANPEELEGVEVLAYLAPSDYGMNAKWLTSHAGDRDVLTV